MTNELKNAVESVAISGSESLLQTDVSAIVSELEGMRFLMKWMTVYLGLITFGIIIILIAILLVLLLTYFNVKKALSPTIESITNISKNAEEISDMVRDEASGIKSTADKIRGNVDDVSSVFSSATASVKDSIVRPIRDVGITIQGVVDAIKALFASSGKL